MNIRVYPEYYKGDLTKKGVEIFGRITPENYSRMYISQDGRIHSYYDKISDDGINIPSKKAFVPVAMIFESVALGIICCMDIDRPDIVQETKSAMSRLNCKYNVIAISAHMTHAGWFSGNSLSPNLHGAYIVLSNGCDYGVKSFIADPEGLKLDSEEILLGSTLVRNCGIT